MPYRVLSRPVRSRSLAADPTWAFASWTVLVLLAVAALLATAWAFSPREARAENECALPALSAALTGGNTSPWRESDARQDLIAAIRALSGDGLDPEDYALSELERLDSAQSGDVQPGSDLDRRFTQTFLLAAQHLARGKTTAERHPFYRLSPAPRLEPRADAEAPAASAESDPNATTLAATPDAPPEASRSLRPREVTPAESDPSARLCVDPSRLRASEILEALRPKRPLYAKLRDSLAEYREIVAAGGWRSIPSGPKLARGGSDPRIPALKTRLAAEHFLGKSAGKGKDTVYDAETEAALKRFQQARQLDDDGQLGPRTLEALNVSAENRLAQVLVNLERLRWDSPIDRGRRLLVNIPSFQAELLDEDRVLWSARIQVGMPVRKTPTFAAEMTHLVLNPTWTVPPTIFKEDILPAARRGEDILKKKNLNVLDRSGRPVDPSTLAWSQYSPGAFPYMLRQDPGAGNALGRVKFLLPNPHDIYLHDTPHKKNFQKAFRAYSSGCIRVDKPLELAEAVLNDPKWPRERLDEVTTTAKTRHVKLSQPLPTVIAYQTATLDAHGRLVLLPDLYERDEPLMRALRQPAVTVAAKGTNW